MTSVGKPIPHDSGVGHVTGRAAFIDDIPPRSDEVVVGFVGSPVSAGTLREVDTSAAAAVPGLLALFTADQVPGQQRFGVQVADEPFLASGALLYLGQPVVVIAAESMTALSAARRAVRITAEEQPAVLSIEDALREGRFLGPERRIASGNVEAALQSAEHVLQGVFSTGGQEQFYLESQAALAFPGEGGQLVVHSSTQNTTEIQSVVAEVLGLARHQVVCVCQRMGGAFGGKETQAALPALMAAFVAQQLGRPARVVYDKDLDMQVTGKRHAYRNEWEVGFDAEGMISALRTRFYSNGGAAADLSPSVMERTLLHAENAYSIPDVEIRGRVCFTNLPPNTAFRGFGGPQAMAAMENIVERIAAHLDRDAYDIRIRNLYGVEKRNLTPYGQVFDKNHLGEIVSTLAATSHYKRRRGEILQQAGSDPLHLRGIALTPVKFGISFTSKFLNQGNALVNVYGDGTIQVSSGGTEMGQGLNTKLRQLVADAFGLPWDRVLVMPTSTEKNNNTSPTAASAGTDLNGAAALDACRQIAQRLREFAPRHFASLDAGSATSPADIAFSAGNVVDVRRPDSRQCTFQELCAAAHRERVDLGARGFYATPGIDFNRETGRGTPFLYFTQGAAVAEVVIDRYTGELRVPRVDLLIDIGRSINPGVDMGQITGGFLQGMGWCTTECLVYDLQGRLLSCSPTTYKIPATTDVPMEWHCALFDNDSHTESVARSKAVGEPPLMLAIAVWAAARDALRVFGPADAIDLQLPATGEEILRCIELLAGAQSLTSPSVTSDLRDS